MKRFILFTLSLTFLLASCGRDLIEVPELTKYGTINISAVDAVNDATTKLFFDKDGKVTWEETDVQLIYLKYGGNYTLPKTYTTTKADIDGDRAYFKGSHTWQGTGTHSFYGYMPAPATGYPSNPEEVPFVIPKTQTQNGTSWDHLSDIMWVGDLVQSAGKVDESESTVSLNYKILYSMIQFQITGNSDNEVIESIEVYSKTGNLSCSSGEVDITQYDDSRIFSDQKGAYGVITYIQESDDNHYAILEVENVAALSNGEEFIGRVYVLPGQHTENIKVTLTTNKGTRTVSIAGKNSTINLERAKIYPVNFDLTEIPVVADTKTERYYTNSAVRYDSLNMNGPIPLFFIGDGYTAEQLVKGGKWDQDLNEAIEALMSVEPYKSFRSYFTAYKLAAESKDEGVTIQSSSITKDTYFRSYYSSGVNMSCSDTAVFNFIKRSDIKRYIPDIKDNYFQKYPVILVVNQDKYGGTCRIWSTGRTIAICPVSKTGATVTSQKHFRSIVIHEAGGHAFGHLADEYISYKTTTLPATGSYSVANLATWNRYGFYKNVTSKNEEDTVPWADFLKLSDATYKNISIIEGAYYYAYGAYRSETYSCMINNRHYFPAHSRYLIMERIHTLASESFSMDVFLAKDNKSVQMTKSFVPEYIDESAVLPPPVLIEER